MSSRACTQNLEEAHRRLAHGAIDVDLDTLWQLLDANGRSESGLDELAGVLSAARRLPSTLTVRVRVSDTAESAAAEAAYRAECSSRARIAWRTAIAMRRNGLRDLPSAVAIATVFGLVAAATGYAAQSTGSTPLLVFLYIVAGISTIAAWASAWLPIEQILFDWRESAHLADTYDLLASASIDVVTSRAPKITAVPASERKQSRGMPVK